MKQNVTGCQKDIKKIKKKRISLITCEYCIFFPTKKPDTFAFKICEKKNIEVKRQNKACDEYQLTNRFWCVKRGYWIETKICLHSYGPEAVNHKCRKCPQGKLIKRISDKLCGKQLEC